MSQLEQGILVGGPYQGTQVEGNNPTQELLPLKSKGGEETIYVRDKKQYPDGKVRWIYSGDLNQDGSDLILPGTVGKTEGDKPMSRVSVNYNDIKLRWEMWLDNELIDVRDSMPSDAAERRLSAVEWLKQMFPNAEGRMVEAK